MSNRLSSTPDVARRPGLATAPLRVLFRHGPLIQLLARRELRDRYAGSALGVIWSFIQPLFLLAVYMAVFSYVFRFRQGVGSGPDLPTDYASYMVAGFVPWYALITAVQAAVPVMRVNTGLVKQIDFPVAVLPVKAAAAQLPLLVIGLAFVVIYQVVRFQYLPLTLLLLPALLVVYVMLVLGLSWLFAGLGVFVRDLEPIIANLSLVAFYLLPIFFFADFTPGILAPLIEWNPFTPMVRAFQDVLVFGMLRDLWAWAFLVGFAVATFVLGFALFDRLRHTFGDVL